MNINLNMIKRLSLCVLLAALFAATGMAAQPKREFRSAWLATYYCIDWPNVKGTDAKTVESQKASLLKYIEDHARRNFTGICFHVRTAADAFYRSSHEPWSEYLTGERGKEPSWDPLAFAVEECHRRGLECYAWVNPFRIVNGTQARNTDFDRQWRKKGWVLTHGKYSVFNPGVKGAREHIRKVVREIYTNYRIDGMLFDDYFYPNRIGPQAADAAIYAKEGKDFASIGDWRRHNVNSFIRELYEQIQDDRPDMRFGLSPAGVAGKGLKDCPAELGLPPVRVQAADWQYDDIYSDPLAWLVEGTLDFISPQIYWNTAPGLSRHSRKIPFDDLAGWWSEVADLCSRHVYLSLSPYCFTDNIQGKRTQSNNRTHWADMARQVDISRKHSPVAPGQIMYSAKYMDGPACRGWGEHLQKNCYSRKALVPVVDWKEPVRLDTPKPKRKGSTLTWGKDHEPEGCDPIERYTVYAIPDGINLAKARGKDGDGIDVRYLLGVTYSRSFEIPSGCTKGHWFAVCSYNGYGQESEPGVVN